MALILATAVVVALAIPEASHDHDDYGPYPVIHRIDGVRYSELSSPPPLRDLRSPGFAETDVGEGAGMLPDARLLSRLSDVRYGVTGVAAESLAAREPRAPLPELQPPARGRYGRPVIGAEADAVLSALVFCESRGDYRVVNTASGAGGGLQFLASTWASVGGVGRAEDATPEEQRYRGRLMLADGRRGEWEC